MRSLARPAASIPDAGDLAQRFGGGGGRGGGGGAMAGRRIEVRTPRTGRRRSGGQPHRRAAEKVAVFLQAAHCSKNRNFHLHCDHDLRDPGMTLDASVTHNMFALTTAKSAFLLLSRASYRLRAWQQTSSPGALSSLEFRFGGERNPRMALGRQCSTSLRSTTGCPNNARPPIWPNKRIYPFKALSAKFAYRVRIQN